MIARNQTPKETNALWGILLIFTLERVEQIRHEARASLGLVEEVIEARRETVRVEDELGHFRFEKQKYPEKLP